MSVTPYYNDKEISENIGFTINSVSTQKVLAV